MEWIWAPLCNVVSGLPGGDRGFHVSFIYIPIYTGFTQLSELTVKNQISSSSSFSADQQYHIIIHIPTSAQRTVFLAFMCFTKRWSVYFFTSRTCLLNYENDQTSYMINDHPQTQLWYDPKNIYKIIILLILQWQVVSCK